MQTLGWILLVIVGIVVAGSVRQPVEQLLRAILGLPSRLLDSARSGLDRASSAVRGAGERARAGLAYGQAITGSSPAWDVVAPLVYLVLLIPIAAGDLVLAGLRFGALLGIPVGVLPISGTTLDLLAGLLFLAVLATFGCVLLDILHITPLRRPYGNVDGVGRKLVLGLAAGGSVLSMIAAVLFFVWGQDAIVGRPSSDLATLFIAVFAIALVGASILAAGGALGAVAALWALLCSWGAGLLSVSAWMVNLVVIGLQGLHEIAVAAVRLLAWPGRVLWNWLASLGVGRSLRLTPLAEPLPPEELPATRHHDRLALTGP